MKHDEIVDGEAMLKVEGLDITDLPDRTSIIDMQRDPQRAAFIRYRLAFRENATHGDLGTARALVAAFDELALALGITGQVSR